MFPNLFRNVSANEQNFLKNRVDNNANNYDSDMGNCPSSYDMKTTTNKKVIHQSLTHHFSINYLLCR